MTLQDRLVQARDDYRSIVPPDATRSSLGAPRRRRWPAVAVAAAILLGAAIGVAAWSGSDDTQKLAATPSRESTADPVVKDPDPPGAVAPYDPQIELVEPGPYHDGQTITVRVPEGFANDLPNGGAEVCAVVADEVGGPSESCDPLAMYTGLAATTTETSLVLPRSVFTPTGMRDCEEPEVTCRVLVRTADNLPRASAPLRFDDALSQRTVELKVDPSSPQGTFRVSVPSIAEAQTWLDPRPSELEPDATSAGMYLTICAFSTSPQADGPFGEYLWSFSPGDNVLPSANCNAIGGPTQVDPANAAAPLEVTPPRWFLGSRGWSDCRVDDCFVQLHLTQVAGSTPGGATLVRDEPVAAALLDAGGIAASGGRAVLALDTPGPHRAGDEVTISVNGLPDGYSTNVGVCHVANSWACGYVGSVFGQIDNGPHTFRLPETLACAPRSCYLELDSKGEGVPPLAVAPLDTPA